MKKIIVIAMALFCVSQLLAKSDAFFSPDDKPTTKLKELLNGAKKTISVAMYMLTDKEIAQALINAQERGIDVTIILDKISTEQYGKADLLAENDVDVFIFESKKAGGRFFSDGPIMHNKFALIDEKIIWTGSFNWTVTANRENQENIIVTDDKELYKKYQAQFNKLLYERSKKYSPSRKSSSKASAKENKPVLKKKLLQIINRTHNDQEILEQLNLLLLGYTA